MKIETTDGIVWIKCRHAAAFAERAASHLPAPVEPDGSSPALHHFEIEPCVIFCACDWCAAHLRESVLAGLVKPGMKLSLENISPVPTNNNQHTLK